MALRKIQDHPTTPFSDQQPGTSGLRKKTRVFMQPHYLENFIQSVFDAVRKEGVDFANELLVLGGDGRYYNRTAIQTILRIAVANGFGQVWVARGGLLSTPAMSAVIRRHGALGGLVLSASHNPAGLKGDFGIKYNVRNGGPAPEVVTETIFRHTARITRYRIIDPVDCVDWDIDREGATTLGETRVIVIDPIADYSYLIASLFDSDALYTLFRSGLHRTFDAMNAVTGPYAHYIFENILGAPSGTVIRGVLSEDFGGLHPDPNLVHGAQLVARITASNAPDFAAACDGDGDRNLILGKNCFVTPGDSLAIITEHASRCIPIYRAGLSGTGTEGAILRLYVERYRKDKGNEEVSRVLAPLVQGGTELLDIKKWCGRDRATVITYFWIGMVRIFLANRDSGRANR